MYKAHRDAVVALLMGGKCTVLVTRTETRRSHRTSNLHEAQTGNLWIMQKAKLQSIAKGITAHLLHFFLCYYLLPMNDLHLPVLHFMHSCCSKPFPRYARDITFTAMTCMVWYLRRSVKEICLPLLLSTLKTHAALNNRISTLGCACKPTSLQDESLHTKK